MVIRVERRKKPLKLSLKLGVGYILLLFFLIFLYFKMVGSPDEMRLKKGVANDPTNPIRSLKLAEYYYNTEKFDEAVRYYKQSFALLHEEDIRCEYLRKIIESLVHHQQFDAIVYIERGLKKGCERKYFLKMYSDTLKVLVRRLDTQVVTLEKLNHASGDKIRDIRTIYVKKGVVLTLSNGLDPSFFLKRLEMYVPDLYSELKNYDASAADKRFSLGKTAKDAEMWESAQNLLGGCWEEMSGADRGRCLYYYAYTFFREKQYSTALSFYKKAKKDWNSTLVNYWLSKTYYNLGMNKEAIDAINFTLKMDPKFPDGIRFREKLRKGE
ncbi:CDC27 family protein [bacterium]|nr:CDC27 family protein [bacterium]